jgi:predicted nucleic acid-binding protein
MMVFADSSYYIALLRSGDQYHSKAVALAQSVRSIVTTQFVLIEVAAAFAKSTLRKRFLVLIDALSMDQDVQIVPAEDSLFRLSLDLYRQRSDKDWSLVDCASFVIMTREKISNALTNDRHFEQAGFTALLK